MNENKNLSHNVYSDKLKNKLTSLPNYLIYNGNQIFVATCITDAIKICSSEERICSIFELAGSNGKYFQHLIDCSKGIL